EFVIGLDSGCGDYERLWVTTSLRGLAAGTLTVEVLTEGVHSGDASGIVPSSCRIARHLLARLDVSATGALRPSYFDPSIPPERAFDRVLAVGCAGDCIADALSEKRRRDGRGRHDSVHGHAWPPFSRSAIFDHRRAGTGGERARSERISARALREKADGVRRRRFVGACDPSLEPVVALRHRRNRHQRERAGGVAA